MCNKIRSSKHENELFFLLIFLLNEYINIQHIEQIKIYNLLSNKVSTKLMYLWIGALNYTPLSLSSREINKDLTTKSFLCIQKSMT